MNTIGYFEIQSSEPARDIKFYETLFGWKFIKQEFAPVEYYRIETKSISGGLLKRPAKVPPTESGTNAFVNSIQVSSFDKTAELILKNGGQVALPKFAIPGRCWQGYFIDLDNNTFGIFEADENAK
ncbi:MAG: VOC family protein [Bacteroidia bacterium]